MKGNGSSWGPFVWCGFKPRMLFYKRLDSGSYWNIRDLARTPINKKTTEELYPATAESENVNSSSRDIDFHSNGFHLRSSNGAMNNSNSLYIFCAWAADPYSTNIGH